MRGIGRHLSANPGAWASLMRGEQPTPINRLGLPHFLANVKIHTSRTHKENSVAQLITRVFMNGNSQAVRIPQEFRLASNRAQISRNAQGDLVIRAVPTQRGTALFEALEKFDPVVTADWMAQIIKDRQEPDPVQERETL
jgi:antitoxin VapB